MLVLTKIVTCSIRRPWARSTISRSCRHGRDVLARLLHGGLSGFRSECKSFRSNDGYIRQPNERQHTGEVALMMLEGRCRGARRIDVAARGSDENSLVLGEQTFSAVGAVTERLAGNDDAVDPSLKLARNRKVIHGGADHNDV